MKYFLVIFSSFLFFTACQTDQQKQEEFVGTYEVSIEAPDANQEMEKARKDMKKELADARKELKKDMNDAREEIEDEFGEDSNLGKAIGSFVEGMGHLANSMTDLGESLGEMGIELGSDILNNVRFNADFQKDGDVIFGKKRGIRFGSDDLKWKIENGKMFLWNENKEEEDADAYEIKNISDSEIDLIGDDVIFHLVRQDEQ
ncbi:MAG: hypothetical protein R2825_03315 [Saprospiraceae bacterium]